MSSGTNLDLILSTDYLSIEDEKILKAKEEKEKITLGEGISLAIEQEQILPSILKSFSEPELEPNYDFRLDDETFDEITKDVNPEYWDEFSNASSMKQAFQIKKRILDAQDANQKLKTLGFTGTALRVGAAILDPAALVADAVTFGFARPFIYAKKAARYSKYIRGGAVGAGQAALVTAPVVMNDPTRDLEEIAYAAVMGGAITSGLTRFLGPKHPDINKFDAKSKELGTAIERTNLTQEGYKITPKGEKYFASNKAPNINESIDEVDNLIPKNEVMLPTKKIITDIKDSLKIKKILQEENKIKKIDNYNIKSQNDYFLLSSKTKELTKEFRGIPASQKDKFFIQSELNTKLDAMQVTDVKILKKYRKKGIGKSIYKLTLEDAFKKQKSLVSDNSVSQSALRVYKSLEKEGFEISYNKDVTIKKSDDLLDKIRGDQVVSNDKNIPVATIKNSQKNVDLLLKDDDSNLLSVFFDRLDITPTIGGKIRGDKSFVLRKSANPYMRSTSEKLLEDSVGNKDYSRSILTADIQKHNYAGTKLTSFYKNYEPAFTQYLEDIGKSTKFKSYNLNDRMQFSNLVSRAVRGEVIDIPAVTRGAEATKRLFKTMLDDLKKDGVTGAADILDNPNYFPRHWSISRLQDVQERVGEGKLINFLKNSLVKGSDNLSDTDGLKLSGHILRMIRESKFSDGFSVDRVLKTTDESELRNLITDYTNLNLSDTDDLVKVLLKPTKPKVPARLSRRASFDETHEEIIDNVSIKFSDLLDNNTEGVVGAYVNQMSGHVAFARTGIKSKNDYLKILDKIKKGYQLPEVAKKYNSKVGKIRKNFEIDTLETIYKNIIGIPTEQNIQGGTATVLRNLRKYNYANVFNQVGFAQIPELGNIIGTAGVRTFVKYIPEFKNILTRAKDGKLSNEFLDEIETLVGGTGSNRLVDSVINRTDDFAGMTTKVGKVEKTLDVATRITSDFSGFHAVDTLSRRLATITSFDKLARHATGKLKLKPSDIKRYKNIGFSEDELQAVFSNIRKNSSFVEGGLTGRKIRRLNVDQWDDQDLVNKMSLYMNRHLRRVIQENNYGEMMAMGADGSLGKTLFQFRNFVMTAYSKQLLHGLHMRDLTFFMSFASSTMLAGLVYIAQQNIQAIGKTGEEREEFIENRLSLEAIGGATFQRNTFSSLLPAVIDTTLYYTGQDMMFNYRSSGLETNLWTGNPTWSLLGNAGKAVRGAGQAITDDEYDFSKRDAYKWLRIAPYQNMLGIRNVLQYMIDGSDLPSTSK